jgi:hypothetical protein
MAEQWKRISDIPGYEEFTNYVLNITGELRNVKTRKKSLRTLKWHPDSRGYMHAVLSQKPAKTKEIKQHRAICCLFKPNPLNLPEVDHINRKKWDNRIENLEWATRVQQMHNRGMLVTNTSGEQNICPTFNRDKPIWLIEMKLDGERRTKQFPRDPNSNVIPQEVKTFRDAMRLEIEKQLAAISGKLP